MEDTNEITRITSFIKDTVAEAGAKTIVIGVSGGVDSAVCLSLCAHAIGPKNVIAVYMPTGNTPAADTEQVYNECQRVGVFPTMKQINGVVSTFVAKVGRPVDKAVMGNIAARCRMIVLYTYANKYRGVVCGTGNRTEYFLGYTTKWGDNAADFYPILHLLKTEVWAMAREMGVIDEIIAKKPSAGLWAGQTDEGEIGMSYYEIDREITEYLAGDGPIDDTLMLLHRQNQHKSDPGKSLLATRW
jgi:NAD+ synthase